MMNLERVGETTSSLISGLATTNNFLSLPRGIIHSYPAGEPGPAPAAVPLASDAAAPPRPATVVRDRRHVLDPGDLEAGRGQRPDRRLPPRTGPLHEDVHTLDAV